MIMIMTQKIKDLLHAIVITIFAIICAVCLIGGGIYLFATTSGTTISIFTSIIWMLIWAGGATLFSWGAYTCWKEYRLHHKNK